MTRRLLTAIGVVTLSALVGAQAKPSTQTGGTGVMYIGTYAGDVQVFDEASEKVVEHIKLKTGIPRSLTPSPDRTRFYIVDSTYEKFEILDIATRKTIDTFTLSEANKRTRITSFQPDPLNRWLIILSRTATKQRDRWEIGPSTLQKYDLATHTVTQTIPWPQGEERETANIRISPDGRLLYFFGDDVLIVDAETFKEVETWQLSRPSESGLGRITFGPVHDFYDDPGTFTGLFTMQDPVQNRRLMGIGRVDLSNKRVDFQPFGPAQPVGFAQSPDRKRAYGLYSDIGKYEFWTFDLVNNSLVSRQEFKGRPRMGLRVSSNGKLLYVYVAGATIDIYEAATYKYLRTIQMNADQTTELYVVPPAAAARTTQR
jgi:DNA-binding beta-propeller fold protein YncE